VLGKGRLIADTSIAGLVAGGRSLEEAFMEMTAGAVEYHAEGSQTWSPRAL
jgi:ABC-2 type transport system ATP-binding protein